MIPELVEQNARASEAVSLYLDSVIGWLDEFIKQFVLFQSKIEAFPMFCKPIVFSTEFLNLDSDVCNDIVRYKSNLAIVNLYCNQPVGWISGEVEQIAPWKTTKRFAVSPKPNSYTDLSPIVFGCYSFGRRFPEPRQLAKKIILDLAQGTIEEKQLAVWSG